MTAQREEDPMDVHEDPAPPVHKAKSVTASDAEFLEWVGDTTADARVLDLHKSNLLRLQIDELLQETLLSVDPSDAIDATFAAKWTAHAQDFVQSVSRMLQSISLHKIPLNDAASPFVQHATQLTIDHLPSTDKKLIVQPRGCFAANVGYTKPAGNAQVLPTLHLSVCFPTEDLLDTKDYQKHKYFAKRNALTWFVAKHLNKKEAKLGKVYWRGSPEHPTLVLIPPTEADVKASDNSNSKKKNKKSKKQQQPDVKLPKKLRFRVELHIAMDNIDWIQPPIRLVPNRCNLGGQVATSHMYNYRLTEDALHCFVEDDLSSSSRQIKEEYPHWNKVVVLAKIWCLQRGILNRHDGLNVDHIALLVLYMYRSKLIGPRMGEQQVMSAFFKLLAETDWLGENYQSAQHQQLSADDEDKNLIRKAPSEGYQDDLLHDSRRKRAVLVLPEDGKSVAATIAGARMAQVYAQQTASSPLTPNDPKTLLELYETTYTLGPVFLDSSMTHNFLGQVSPACMRLIQQEAKKGLDFLHLTAYNKPFNLLFMSEARFFKRHDAYMELSLKEVSFKLSALWGYDRKDLGDYESLARGLVRVLKRALTDRVTDIQLLSTGNGMIQPSTAANGTVDSDEIPTFPISGSSDTKSPLVPPTGKDKIILGLSLNPDTCWRLVDRGPPADDVEATDHFVELWGKEKAELRRFKDGAIVHASVWESSTEKINDGLECDTPYFQFQNDDKVQGGIVERIVRHTLRQHFVKPKKPITACFGCRDIMSAIDGVIPEDNKDTVTFNPLVAHRLVMKAFEDLSSFLREESQPSIATPGSDKKRSRLGIPLSIDAVEPLDAALRYAELFPPIPHPLLGGPLLPGVHKASSAITSNPIQVQIRFGSSSKWPTDLRAIGAAKTAMLVQLADGIDALRRSGRAQGFYGSTAVASDHADFCFKGYVFRVHVRADPELKLLSDLNQPSEEARKLLQVLTKKHVVGSKHHSLVHAVYNSHPSSSMVVRLARKWLASHMFSGLIPFEAIELLVVHAYTGTDSPLGAPATVFAGLLRFFHVLISHNWESEALIVDPQRYLSEEQRMEITKQFETARGPQNDRGPPMYIVAPYDHELTDEDVPGTSEEGQQPLKVNGFSSWRPSFTSEAPEIVVLARARQLAQRSYTFLFQSTAHTLESTNSWPSLFHESTESFRAYSALLRVDSGFVVDSESSSSTSSALVKRNEKLGVWQTSYSRSMYQRYYGPKDTQIKLFKNMMTDTSQLQNMVLQFNPVNEMVSRVRRALGQLAVFWYNDLCPEVITMLWRPKLFSPKPFSAVTSEFVRPVTASNWKKDTLVTVGVSDIMAELACHTGDIIADQKILHNAESPIEEEIGGNSKSSPLIKGYLPLRIKLPSPAALVKIDEDDESDSTTMETFVYIKQHQGPGDTDGSQKEGIFFVANVPAYPGVQRQLLLKSIFGRYGEVSRVTVVPNPRRSQQEDSLTLFASSSQTATLPSFLPPAQSGKFAHVVMKSAKDLKRTLKHMTQVMSQSTDGDGANPGLSLDTVEIQTLADESDRLQRAAMKQASSTGTEESNEDDFEDDDDNEMMDKKETSNEPGLSSSLSRYHKARRFFPSRAALLEECNAAMEEWEDAQEEARRAREAAANQPDDDGFVTVTYNTTTATAGEEALDQDAAGSKRKSKRQRSRNKKRQKGNGASELQDFYRFQTKEQQKKTLHELRERFEEDLKKVKQMRQDKQYRPF